MRTFILFLVAAVLYFLTVMAPLPPVGQDKSHPNTFSTARDKDHFVDTTIGKEFHYLPMPQFIAERPLKGDVRHFPVLFWRLSANQPQNPAVAFFLMAVVTNLVWLLLPKALAEAAQTLRNDFWRSFGYALIIVCATLLIVRILFISVVGETLAYVLIASLGIGYLLGISTSAYVMGKSILRRLGLKKESEEESRLDKFCYLSYGTFVFSLLLLIPNIGEVPRIGTRLITIYCMLGLGALVRSKLRSKFK